MSAAPRPAFEGRGGLDLEDVLTGDGSPLCGWGVCHRIVEKQGDSPVWEPLFSISTDNGDLCVGQGALSLLSFHIYLTLGGLVTRTVRQHLNLNNAEQLCR